jgi:HEAT repeat protein
MKGTVMNERLDELLTQLKQLSPMPDDQSVSQEQLDAYSTVIDELYHVLKQDNDPRAIQPLIDSFGYIDGFGVYHTTLTILGRFDDKQLMPHLLDAVQHGERGSRAWAALMLGHTQDRAVVPYLLPLLNDPEEHVRADAAIALGNIGDPSTRQAIEQLKSDPSIEVRDAVDIALEEFGKNDGRP